jgi:hypothetical protein
MNPAASGTPLHATISHTVRNSFAVTGESMSLQPWWNYVSQTARHEGTNFVNEWRAVQE